MAVRVILCMSYKFGGLRFARLVPVKTTISETAAQVVQASEQPDSPAYDKNSRKLNQWRYTLNDRPVAESTHAGFMVK